MTADDKKPARGLGRVFGEVDPANPDYDQLRKVLDTMIPFGVHAGVQVTELGPDRAVAELPDEPQMGNHLRTVHAGALFTAADVAGGCAMLGAVATRLDIVESFVLKDSTVSFRKPAVGRIRAVATIDQRDVQAVLGATGQQRFDVDGRALLFDANDVCVGKVQFEYVCTVNAEEN